MKRFIIFEDRLNNFWVIKSRKYRWKKFAKMSGFFFRGFFMLESNLGIWIYMNVV